MKTLRTLHIYLGCAFAPLLAFFLLSGFLQTLNLHEKKKSGYTPPAWAEQLGSIHMHQRFATAARAPNWPVRIVFAATCIGLFSTTTLGIVMAWRMRGVRRRAIIAMGAGVIVPLGILLAQQAMPAEPNTGRRGPPPSATQPSQ